MPPAIATKKKEIIPVRVGKSFISNPSANHKAIMNLISYICDIALLIQVTKQCQNLLTTEDTEVHRGFFMLVFSIQELNLKIEPWS